MRHAIHTTLNLTTNAPEPRNFFRPTAALWIGAALLAGCGGGGFSGAGGGGGGSQPTVTETLETLGVNTQEGPLVDENDELLPEDYSPLGAIHELEKLSELIVLGVASPASADRLSLFDAEFDPAHPEQKPRLLTSFDEETVPWASERVPEGAAPVASRAGMSADLDGDGREEQVFAHFDAEWMRFTIIEDAELDYARYELEVFELFGDCLDVNVAAADVDGDGDREIVLGYSLPFQAHLAIFDYAGATVTTKPIIEHVFEPRHDGNLLMLELTAGNLDHDSREELGVVVNEFYVSLNDPATPCLGEGCTAYVLDDVATELDPLLVKTIEIIDNGLLFDATSADLDLGDLDADGLDEIVIAGSSNRAADWCLGRYVLISLDDAVHGLADLGSRFLEEEVGNEPGAPACELVVNWAHVDLVDLTGDHACEVHVNEVVFADWSSAEPWTELAQLSNSYPAATHVDPSVLAFAAADFTGDIRQDLAVYGHHRSEVVLWGIAADDPDQELRILERIELQYDSPFLGPNPQLIPVNPDSDSTMLRFLDRTYVMTEPVIMAVLAAAPNTGNPGQNVDANSTEFGNAHTTGTGSEHQVSVSVGFVVGTEFQLWGNGWEVEASLKADYQHVFASSSELTTSLTFASGPEEDTVICTVSPYDVYRYLVVSDPDPASIGQVVQLIIPRNPITLQVEREFYNSAVGGEAIKIDASVLPHTIGDPGSYPTKEDKDQKVATTRVLQTGPVGVGQGSGSTSLAIAVTQETGHSAYLGFEAEFSASTTLASVKVGGTFGLGYGHTWSWSVGDETSYTGTVGSIDAEHFAADNFAFGLFCYWHRVTGRDDAFQVVNYWVE